MGEAARHFGVDLDWRGPEGTAVTSAARPAILGTGASARADGQGWNPEELLLGALGLCLLRTFEGLALREGMHVARCRCRVEATLSPMPYGAHVKQGFTLLTAHVEVAVPPDEVPLARDLMIEAKQSCCVANALMPPVHLDLAVEASQPELVGARH